MHFLKMFYFVLWYSWLTMLWVSDEQWSDSVFVGYPFYFNFVFHIGILLINNVVIVLAGQQRDSAIHIYVSSSVHFSLVAQSCPNLCGTPGLPVHHQHLESTKTHVHWVGDTIQPSHPLSSPSPPVLNLSQHQGIFKWVISSHQVAKVLEFQLEDQSFQWTPRTDLL